MICAALGFHLQHLAITLWQFEAEHLASSKQRFVLSMCHLDAWGLLEKRERLGGLEAGGLWQQVPSNLHQSEAPAGTSIQLLHHVKNGAFPVRRLRRSVPGMWGPRCRDWPGQPGPQPLTSSGQLSLNPSLLSTRPRQPSPQPFASIGQPLTSVGRPFTYIGQPLTSTGIGQTAHFYWQTLHFYWPDSSFPSARPLTSIRQARPRNAGPCRPCGRATSPHMSDMCQSPHNPH